MSGQLRTSRLRDGVIRTDSAAFDALAELALDMRWSWSHVADELWQRLDSALWDLTHNPWGILQTVSRDRIECLWSEVEFRSRVDELIRARREALEAPAWYQKAHADAKLSFVAYFSMEFMLSEALPIYSGGLGNVAGDQLKASSDLGVPMIGVGLLYSQGYFRQIIDNEGAQQSIFPYNDPGQLPITPVRGDDGQWLRLQLDLPGYPIWLRAWQVQVGRTTLYLLDSNDAANYPPYRGITSELYGGGPDLRLLQEMVLGIGGWRLLDALGLNPDVCHINEGHGALVVLERARSHMRSTGSSFEEALAVTRAGNLFTTHTAVAAGFDLFAPSMIEHCLGDYAEQQLGITRQQLLAMGRMEAADASEPFNMAYLAIRGSGAVNAVSRLHGEVSRRLFAPLFPRWPEAEVPVGHITNGIHTPSWDSQAADKVWTDNCGKGRWREATEQLGQSLRCVSDASLWQMRSEARASLVTYVRDRLTHQLAAAGGKYASIEQATQLFDSTVLTLGFARRFAAYKRPNLLLHDPQRLLRLLSGRERPVQLLIAGKAHPADLVGQRLIQEWMHFIRTPEARPHVVFLSDYDMLLTEQMVQGVDVWLNTPRRPWEACGTSGMKVLVNGGLNLSVLDGWWAEAYAPESGWALESGEDTANDTVRDAADAQALYDLLEHSVIPEFYRREPHSGIPLAWVARMRESMANLTPHFSTNRVVREYTELHYLPAAARLRERSADKDSYGAKFIAWRGAIEQCWPYVRFGELTVRTLEDQYHFEIRVVLAGLEPGHVRVELYAEGTGGARPTLHQMRRVDDAPLVGNAVMYCAQVAADRPAVQFTPRIVPYYRGANIPLEAGFILWQR